MAYRPITKSFQEKFGGDLTYDFPEYFHQKIIEWLCEFANISRYSSWSDFISLDIAQRIQITVRDTLPSYSLDFFIQSDLVIEVLNFAVRECPSGHSSELGAILSIGGHAYKVAHIGTKQVGLEKRVSDELENASEEALNESDLLREAWNAFYKKDPNLELTVARCINALETRIKEKYYPQDLKPSIGRFINQMNSDKKVKYIGSVVDSDRKLFEICSSFADYRGQHTSGSGKIPTKEDAEFILHTSVLLYNMI